MGDQRPASAVCHSTESTAASDGLRGAAVLARSAAMSGAV